MEPSLLIASLLILFSITACKLSDKSAVPALVFFLLIGMLAGAGSIGGVSFRDPMIARQIGIIALVFIIFTGGFDTEYKDLRPILFPGLIMATAGVLLTALIVGFSAVYFLHFKLF